MLQIVVFARSLRRRFLSRRGAVLAALIAAIIAGIAGPFVASVDISPTNSDPPAGPKPPIVVKGVVASTTDGTTATALSISNGGDVEGPLPFDSILTPTDDVSNSALNDLLDLQTVGLTTPFDNLAFVSTSALDPTSSPDFTQDDPGGFSQNPQGLFGDGLFFSSGGGISSGPSPSDPGDLTSLSSPLLDFTVTLGDTDNGPSDEPGAGPGLSMPGKIFGVLVPEPSILLLMSAGLGGLVFLISRLVH